MAEAAISRVKAALPSVFHSSQRKASPSSFWMPTGRADNVGSNNGANGPDLSEGEIESSAHGSDMARRQFVLSNMHESHALLSLWDALW